MTRRLASTAGWTCIGTVREGVRLRSSPVPRRPRPHARQRPRAPAKRSSKGEERDMPNCQAIKKQLDFLIEMRQEVQQELKTAPPSERPALIAQLKQLNQAIAAKQRQYNLCIHPPLPKPDL